MKASRLPPTEIQNARDSLSAIRDIVPHPWADKKRVKRAKRAHGTRLFRKARFIGIENSPPPTPLGVIA